MKDSEWIDEYGRRSGVAAGVVWYYMSNIKAVRGGCWRWVCNEISLS